MADLTQYVTLGVGGELFAAPVEKVQEILDVQPIARLPQAPPNLLGMIDVRGQGIPVLDLRVTLGLAPAEDNENTRIIVLRVKPGATELTVGLRADRVFEVTVLDHPELDPPPAVSGAWTGRSIAGIEPGRQLTARGRIAIRDDRKVIYNPYYELEAPR